LTRGGTVKLGNFAHSRIIASDRMAELCRTPNGAPDYMCAEKQYNLKRVTTIRNYKNYSTAADIWSLGVLVLHMVCYYPNEKWHRLPRTFALQMGERGMPFRWMVNDMMQLCVRMAQSGDGNLKKYLNDTMLNVDPRARPTAKQILDSYLIKKWCNESLAKVALTNLRLYTVCFEGYQLKLPEMKLFENRSFSNIQKILKFLV
uniref:non-specific serine/threonine protein kinase n=1 Tax=Gongylonema pulchrum TaxID=637853 RepID=A0A183DCT5_9BILA